MQNMKKKSPIIIEPEILQVVAKLLKISLLQPASVIKTNFQQQNQCFNHTFL